MIYSNPRHLKAFVALASTRSFNAAAQAVHIGQPALSQAIAGLEELAGVKLIERTTRSVALTAAGEEFLADARRVLDANERLLAHSTDLAQARRGRIELLAIPSMAHRLLPMMVREFAQAHEHVKVDVHDLPDPALRQRLARGEGDLAIMTALEDKADFNTLPFLRDHFRVVVPAAHPLARQTAVEVGQLANERLILLRRGTLFRSFMDAAVSALELQHSPLEVDQPATLVGMVEAGLGIALLPAMSCPTPALHSVTNLPLVGIDVHRLIAFALPAGREPTPAVQAFLRNGLDFLAANNPRLPGGCELLSVGAEQIQLFLTRQSRPSPV